MPVWTNYGSGTWSNAANWTGGVPNAIGATAIFDKVANTGVLTAQVSIAGGTSVTIGLLDMIASPTSRYSFESTTTGGGNATIVLQDTDGTAAIVARRGASFVSLETEISGRNGLRLSLASDTVVDVQQFATLRIDATIFGSGTLRKFSDGILVIGGNNLFSGGIDIFDGTVNIASGSSLGSGPLTFKNTSTGEIQALLVSGFTSISNPIIFESRTAGTIAVASGENVLVNSNMNFDTDRFVTFGSFGFDGHVVLSSSQMFVSNFATIQVSNGRVSLGTQTVTDAFGDAQRILVASGAILDTQGTVLSAQSALDGDGDVQSSSGALDVRFAATSNVFQGRFIGTDGADRVGFTASSGAPTTFTLSQAEFVGWTGNDRIEIAGDDSPVLGDFLTGSSLRDTMDGKGGDDILAGAGGDDVLIGGEGSDTLIGGAGIDTASYATSFVGVAARLDGGANTGAAAGDTYSSIENLTGSGLADTLIGDLGANVLDGREGVDAMFGGGGDDTIVYSPEDGTIDGGAGFDTARAATNAGLTIRLDAWNVEQLFAGGGNDVVFTFGTAAYAVDGGGGNDSISGNVFGDTLGGNIGNDVLDGRQGNDTLGGGTGSDRLLGGEGADTLFGEADPDAYVYRGLIDAGDTIIGFETFAARGVNNDRLEIQRFGFDMGLAPGALDPNRFVAGPATLAVGQFLFDTATGNLFWDGDGTGAGVAQFLLRVQGVSNLTAADFMIT